MDDVRIYDVALSQLEIQAIMSPPASALPTVSTINWEGANLRLEWIGGNPPYQVQLKRSLNDSEWLNLGGTTSSNSLLIVPTNGAGFYQIQSQ